MPTTAPVAVPAGATVVMVPRREMAPLRRVGALGLLLAVPVVLLMTLWPTHFLLRAKPRVVRGIEWLHAREMLEWARQLGTPGAWADSVSRLLA